MSAPLVVGNWKMNGTSAECAALAREIVRELRKRSPTAEVAVAPPFTALPAVQRALHGSAILLSAQNCHWQDSGAFTGEISPAMLTELGCAAVIIGHSERRHILKETDRMIADKIVAALRHTLRVILCVGETLAERRSGRTAATIGRQLRLALKGIQKAAIENVEIAYEPVWAIGTGQNATVEQISRVHKQIRTFLTRSFGAETGNRLRILYGGSVKPDNAAELVRAPNVNGFLVGGASLSAETFLPIVRSFDR